MAGAACESDTQEFLKKPFDGDAGGPPAHRYRTDLRVLATPPMRGIAVGAVRRIRGGGNLFPTMPRDLMTRPGIDSHRRASFTGGDPHDGRRHPWGVCSLSRMMNA